MKKRSFLASHSARGNRRHWPRSRPDVPGRSLTVDEAQKITELLVSLSPDLGAFAYDEEEADRWFDEDAATGGRIAAAGFNRESWKEAVDATFRGYLATIPADVFAEQLAAPIAAAGELARRVRGAEGRDTRLGGRADRRNAVAARRGGCLCRDRQVPRCRTRRRASAPTISLRTTEGWLHTPKRRRLKLRRAGTLAARFGFLTRLSVFL